VSFDEFKGLFFSSQQLFAFIRVAAIATRRWKLVLTRLDFRATKLSEQSEIVRKKFRLFLVLVRYPSTLALAENKQSLISSTSSEQRDPERKSACQVRGHFAFRDRAKEWHGLRHQRRSSNANRMSSRDDEANDVVG